MVRSGDVEAVKTLLSSQTIDLNQVKTSRDNHSGGTTPLMLASMGGHLKMVDLLIKEGAQVNFYVGNPVRSALMKAVGGKRLDVVELLMQHGAEVTRQHEKCALTNACELGNMEMVKMLLPDGPGPDAINLSDVSASHVTCSIGSNLSYSYVKSPVSIALEKGHTELLKWFLEGGAKVPAGALHHAILLRNNNINMVKLLLKYGAKVNGEGCSALMIASYKGDTEIVKILLKERVNINYKNKDTFALMIAAVEGHADVVGLLLEGGANVNLKGGNLSILMNVFDYLPEDKLIGIVTLLLEGGANLEPEVGFSESILTLAINRKYVKIVKLLLLLKTSDSLLNLQNSLGEYPLMRAVDFKGMHGVEIAKLLLEAGAKTDLRDNAGRSLLMHVADASITQLLLDKEVPINLQDNDGKYALLYAAERRFYDIVELLLKNGASPTLENDDGKSALSTLQKQMKV